MKEGSSKMTKRDTSAEAARFDLAAFFYDGLDDPRLEDDIAAFERYAAAFHKTFKGKLAANLGDALVAYLKISELSEKVGLYLFLRSAVDTTDEAVKTKLAEVEERLAAVSSEHLTFFSLEIIALPQKAIDTQAKKSAIVAHHGPWIKQVRKDRPYVLSEEVESALSLFSPFGATSWARYFDEAEADLRFPWDGGEKTLTDMITTMSDDRDRMTRHEAERVVDEVLRARFLKFAAQSLNVVIGEKRTDDKKRGYKHPMDARNQDNMISDEVVEALHLAVLETAVPIAREYHRLKGALLGIEGPLYWSDRNAPMPFSDNRRISYDDAVRIVVKAYERFSPTLAEMIRTTIDEKRIDAPALPNRRGGAFNASLVLPDGRSMSFTFLNYQGAARDVMDLAHELGHGVHHTLSGDVQGILQQNAPLAYAETASVFGEMTTFNALKEDALAANDTNVLLSLLMGKLSDMVNTIVRQVSFSLFEQICHGAGRRLSPDEFSTFWMEVTKRCYGPDGDIFDYSGSNMGSLWCYISHFQHTPFYVYAYACGALFTQSIYAKQDEYGEQFEPLYLDLLRAGGTKDAVELLKPFGLDPTSPSFWEDGIEAGMGTLLREAKEVARQRGVTI